MTSPSATTDKRIWSPWPRCSAMDRARPLLSRRSMAETLSQPNLSARRTDRRLTNNLEVSALPTILGSIGLERGRRTLLLTPTCPSWRCGARSISDLTRPFALLLVDALTGRLPRSPSWTVDSSMRRAALRGRSPARDVRSASLLSLVYDAVTRGPGWQKTLLIINYDEWGALPTTCAAEAPIPNASAAAGDRDGRWVSARRRCWWRLGHRRALSRTSPSTIPRCCASSNGAGFAAAHSPGCYAKQPGARARFQHPRGGRPPPLRLRPSWSERPACPRCRPVTRSACRRSPRWPAASAGRSRPDAGLDPSGRSWRLEGCRRANRKHSEYNDIMSAKTRSIDQLLQSLQVHGRLRGRDRQSGLLSSRPCRKIGRTSREAAPESKQSRETKWKCSEALEPRARCRSVENHFRTQRTPRFRITAPACQRWIHLGSTVHAGECFLWSDLPGRFRSIAEDWSLRQMCCMDCGVETRTSLAGTGSTPWHAINGDQVQV